MIEELEKKYEEFRGVVEVLPVNTKYNRKRKIDCLTDEEKNDNDMLEIVKKEIDSRLSYLNNLKENENIELLKKETKCIRFVYEVEHI